MIILQSYINMERSVYYKLSPKTPVSRIQSSNNTFCSFFSIWIYFRFAARSFIRPTSVAVYSFNLGRCSSFSLAVELMSLKDNLAETGLLAINILNRILFSVMFIYQITKNI